LQQATTRNRGKAIVNSPPPIYDQEPSVVAEDDEIGTGYDNQRIVKVTGDRENVEVTPDAADNSRPIFDTEPLQKVPNNDNYNVFSIKSEHPEQSKSVNDTYPIEQNEHNVIIDSLDMSYDRQQVDHDDDDDLANERDLLASLIKKLKCEIDDSKNLLHKIVVADEECRVVKKLVRAAVDYVMDYTKSDGGKDRPPMLAPGNYVQQKSRIKRYIDTKPNNELIHYCLQNPPYKFKWTKKTVLVVEGSSETTTEGYMKNYKNASQDIRNHLDAKAEAVKIILTEIDNDIYSTVVACLNACEMWKDIEWLNQGTQVVQQYGIQCYNCKEYGHVARESDWTENNDDELEDQKLEAHYLYMAQIQEVTPDVADNFGPIFDTEPLQKVQNDDDNYNVFANEREHPEQ
nr:hypothetical protein [Tanacetum cinerariifolium]